MGLRLVRVAASVAPHFSCVVAHAVGQQGDTQPRLRWPLLPARRSAKSAMVLLAAMFLSHPFGIWLSSRFHLAGEERVRRVVPRQHRAFGAVGVCAVAGRLALFRFPGSFGWGSFCLQCGPESWSCLCAPCHEHPPVGGTVLIAPPSTEGARPPGKLRPFAHIWLVPEWGTARGRPPMVE